MTISTLGRGAGRGLRLLVGFLGSDELAVCEVSDERQGYEAFECITMRRRGSCSNKGKRAQEEG
jgi:hypothetical protein